MTTISGSRDWGRMGDWRGETNLQLFPLGIDDSKLREREFVRAWQHGAQPLLW